MAEAMSVRERERVRRISKTLFGNADRLEVAVAIAEDPEELFYAQRLSEQLRIAPARVRAQLLTFSEAGLMRPLPRTEVVRYYQRMKSPFWDAALAVADLALELGNDRLYMLTSG